VFLLEKLLGYWCDQIHATVMHHCGKQCGIRLRHVTAFQAAKSSKRPKHITQQARIRVFQFTQTLYNSLFDQRTARQIYMRCDTMQCNAIYSRNVPHMQYLVKHELDSEEVVVVLYRIQQVQQQWQTKRSIEYCCCYSLRQFQLEILPYIVTMCARPHVSERTSMTTVAATMRHTFTNCSTRCGSE
jgi:hypothetical protein